FDHRYKGLPLYAHCLLPSSRVMTVQSPEALESAPAVSGGQLVAHGPLQALLPPASLSNVYTVIPALLVIMPPVVLAGASCASAVPAMAMPATSVAMQLLTLIATSMVIGTVRSRRLAPE